MIRVVYDARVKASRVGSRREPFRSARLSCCFALEAVPLLVALRHLNSLQRIGGGE